MKQINVAKNQQILFNHVVPTNAVYGRFTFEFTRRVRTDKVLLDKNGRIIFGENGKPKYRYKKIPTKTTAVFSVENFTLYKFRNERHLYAYILYENGQNWHEVALGDTPFSKALEEVVLSYIKEHDLKEPERPHIKTKVRSIAPKRRRENQFDNVFRMRPEYSGTINEEVRPRMPIVHTNMDKLHPIDDKAVYTPKPVPEKWKREEQSCCTRVVTMHSYKDSDYINPETRKPAREGYNYVK